MRSTFRILLLGFLAIAMFPIAAQEPVDPIVKDAPRQPLLSQVHRLSEALETVGSPLGQETLTQIDQLKTNANSQQVTREIQRLLDPLCLAVVEVQSDGAPRVLRGPCQTPLMEQGWATYLIKVVNPVGLERRLEVESPNAKPIPHAPADQVESRWMQLSMFEGQPMKSKLSGLPLEYRILQIYSRDRGPKQAVLEFSTGGGTGESSELVRDWRFDDNTDGWYSMNNADLSVNDGSMLVKSTGDDPFIGTNIEADGGPMVLRFWGTASEGGMGQVFWWTEDRPYADGGRQRTFPLEPNKPQLYEVAFNVSGTLKGVRIDPLIDKGNMKIDWISLYSARKPENWQKLSLEMDCQPATTVTFVVRDTDGQPGFARFLITDQAGQVYPTQSKRLAPDFFFQRHIYRGDGETVQLPPGQYTVVCARGPESIPETKELIVEDQPVTVRYQVKRWIDPSLRGWWSGDHHIHAAGCQHYESPTQGVKPEDMIRHTMGEDLKVGCCLTWGPCFDFQKRFFTGSVAEQSNYPYLLRYDVEVSGFGSHASGHLNLLNLKEQIYPGGESKDHWPTLGLNTLRWAKRQGAVCGPAHSAIGLTRFVDRVPETDGMDGPDGLPTFNIPAYDGIGANEFIMNVTHKVPGKDGKLVRAVDFISAMDTDRTAEWNMWYHVLNCGIRVNVSGETDFPCISGERVGLGRVYAHVPDKLTFENWVQAIADGRSYVSDGNAHLMDYRLTTVDGDQSAVMGINGSELRLQQTGKVRAQVSVAARLDNSAEIPVELIVNGYPVERKMLTADGTLQELSFETKLDRSSWVAIRAFPHAHTNPIYVLVDEQPLLPSSASVRWCLMGVDQCWQSKQNTYAASEQEDARLAYEHARQVYRQLLADSQALGH